MKNRVNWARLYLCVAAAALMILSLYFYSMTSKAMPVFEETDIQVKKVSRFTSMAPGIFILHTAGESNASLGAIFAAVGYDVMEGDLEEYKEQVRGQYILLVSQQEAEALDDEALEYICRKISEGQKVITWGKAALSERLGIQFLDKSRKIDGYIWNDKREVSLAFEEAASLELFSFKGGPRVLAEDENQNPVMISSAYGKGGFIYSGIPLVNENGDSHEYFPFIIEAIKAKFGLTPVFSRNDLAFYVDMDYHIAESPEALAERIRSYGGDQIHLSAWYPKEKYGNKYKEIIEACHQRGISVVAWFELPFVSIDFWDEHPQWREKTASGEDAHIDWRCLMALNDPEALKAIKLYVADLMRSYDWDGADIAEIYFESPGEGFDNKDQFTPMNQSFRQSFRERYGVDPMEAFAPLSDNYWKRNEEMKQNLIDYRVELITMLHEEFLKLCEELKQDMPYLKTTITVIDSIADRNMKEYIGVDAEQLVKLQDKYHFTLQIEDPFTLWNLGPGRYRVIGEEYRGMMEEGNELAIDINVIDRGGEVYPTKKQRGVELYQLINNASKHTDKVILYALGTFEDSDMQLAPFAAGNDIHVQEDSPNEYVVNAAKRFIWNTGTKEKTFLLDGVKWPFVSAQGVMIPAGEHKLVVEAEKNEKTLRIENINGDVSAVAWTEGLSFSYSSPGRCYMTMNKKPQKVTVDGDGFEAKILENGGQYTIILPCGQHQVVLY